MVVIELAGAVTGVTSVWLLTKQNSLGWLLGLVYISLSMILFLDARLYGELIAHFVFFVLSLYGWMNWIIRKRRSEQDFLPSYLNQNEQYLYLMIFVSIAILAGYLFSSFTNNSMPYLDSVVMSASFAGMWLSAIKKIENWQLWMLVNFLSINIYAYQALYIYSLLYCLFLLQAFNGFSTWKRDAIRQT